MNRNKLLASLAGGGVLLAACLLAGPQSARADEIPEEYRETVRKGLKYLAGDGSERDRGQQFKDGHWGANGDQYPVAMTGLAGLALLLEGSTVREGRYSANIRKAADWLMDKSQRQANRNGLIFSEHATETGRYMYGHGFATLFLACCYGEEDDRIKREKMKDVLTRAVEYIKNAQSTQGGYFYTSRVEGHDQDEGSVTVTQLQALRACRNAGIPVPKDTVNKSIEYLKKSTSQDGGVVYSLGRGFGGAVGGGRPALTAAAISCSFSSNEFKNEYVKKWFTFCKRHGLDSGGGGFGVRLGHDEYTHYYFGQAMYSLGDDGWEKMFGATPANERMTWSAYRTSMFGHLKRTQNADGSWNSGGGFSVGPIYTTAIYCTIMQLDRGIVPFYMRAVGKSE